MGTINLNVIEVKAYYEMARVSNKTLSFKVAVLKVKYDNGSWETIFRNILSYAPLSTTEKRFMEQYKSLSLEQIRQISYILNEKDQKIFGLYLKKYFKNNLNINMYIAKRSKIQYVESKMLNILSMTKSMLQQFSLSLKKYSVNSEKVTNI